MLVAAVLTIPGAALGSIVGFAVWDVNGAAAGCWLGTMFSIWVMTRGVNETTLHDE